MRIFLLYSGYQYEGKWVVGCFRTLDDAKKAAKELRLQRDHTDTEWGENLDADGVIGWICGSQEIEIQESEFGTFRQWKGRRDKEKQQLAQRAAEDKAAWDARASQDSSSSDLSPEPHDLC